MTREVAYKRLETDREYRARVLAHPRCVGFLFDQAQIYNGRALDDVGDFIGCQRRIVEEWRA